LQIDLRATYIVSRSPIKIEYVLLMECKRAPGNVWTFIKGIGDVVISKNASSIWDDIDTAGRPEELAEILKPITKVNSLVAESYSNRFKEIIVDERISDKKDDNLLNCTERLAKAVYFEQRMHEKTNAVLTAQTEDVDYVKIHYPMIVFEGDIYEGTTLPSPTVRQISSVHLNKFSIENKEQISLTIDVVNVEKLKDFLKKGMLAEAKEIISKERKNRRAYVRHIHKIKQKKRLTKDIERLEGVIPKVSKIPKII